MATVWQQPLQHIDGCKCEYHYSTQYESQTDSQYVKPEGTARFVLGILYISLLLTNITLYHTYYMQEAVKSFTYKYRKDQGCKIDAGKAEEQ